MISTLLIGTSHIVSMSVLLQLNHNNKIVLNLYTGTAVNAALGRQVSAGYMMRIRRKV